MDDKNKDYDVDKITFIQLLRLLGNIKATVLWGIVFSFISCTSLVISFVYYKATQMQIEKTAIARGNSFDISIENDELKKCFVSEATTEKNGISCKKFILLEPFSHDNLSSLQFLIRKIDDNDSLVIYPVGLIKTNKIRQEKFQPFNFSSLSQPVLAQETRSHVKTHSFNWYGHESDYQFHEKYVSKYTIQRYYSDGWVLEYKVTKDHRSIPSSFRWIRKNNRNNCLFNFCLSK